MTAQKNSQTSQTAKEKAYSKIRSGIFLGHFKPGTELREGQLAELCGVSRTPVRQALQMLATEGLVSLEKNMRAVVVDAQEAHTEEIFDLLSLLEGYSIRLAARNITDEQLAELRSINDRMLDVVNSYRSDDQEGALKYLELNSQFHRSIHKISSNVQLYEMLHRVVDFPQTIYLKFGRLAESAVHAHQHDDILDALANRDEVYAEIEMKRHIESIRRKFHKLWNGD